MMNRRLIDKLAADQGQTMTEYSLLIVLIAVVVALAIPAVTSSIEGIFRSAAAAF